MPLLHTVRPHPGPRTDCSILGVPVSEHLLAACVSKVLALPSPSSVYTVCRLLLLVGELPLSPPCPSCGCWKDTARSHGQLQGPVCCEAAAGTGVRGRCDFSGC